MKAMVGPEQKSIAGKVEIMPTFVNTEQLVQVLFWLARSLLPKKVYCLGAALLSRMQKWYLIGGRAMLKLIKVMTSATNPQAAFAC